MQDSKPKWTQVDFIEALDHENAWVHATYKDLMGSLSVYPDLSDKEKQHMVYIALRGDNTPRYPSDSIPCMKWIDVLLETHDMDFVRGLLLEPELEGAYRTFRDNCVGECFGSKLPTLVSLWDIFQEVPAGEEQRYLDAFTLALPNTFRTRAYEFSITVARFLQTKSSEHDIVTFPILPDMHFALLIYMMLILYQQRDESRSTRVNEGTQKWTGSAYLMSYN
ncbi:hypothetical protein F5Y04DRAFT_207998 [Hypomontagnella monticulosa]|nr:hypothetical protein F5Y04DRAFT_207998 [Hypomontagnella monticulosa]